ncbi:ARM repeat-containing protein [Hesseltinella vesiculosa]|uniref:ARM repeat-containing protein n=1 Tax=Hesseltinella vesiculosa TaxID=101127 RepID=A0A1X2GAJ2_9FUNG|nr:ARM repeat-containing protein [Hesseltinella vesiculosa]
MDQLLQQGQLLDVDLFDATVDAFYHGSEGTRKQAQHVLTAFGNDPNAWQSVATIFDRSNNVNAKYLALRVLERFVTVFWYTIPVEKRLDIRNYIVQQVIDLASSGKAPAILLSKLNVILVQILKKDWLKHWPGFIEELVAASPTNLSLCENNLQLIKLFCEDVFEVTEAVTIANRRKLETQMKRQAGLVVDLCLQILATPSVPSSLSCSALDTLVHLVSFSPSSAPAIAQHLSPWVAKSRAHRKLAMACYTEIISLDGLSADFVAPVLLDVLPPLLQLLAPFTPTSDPDVYDDLEEMDQACIQHAALFLQSLIAKPVELLHGLHPESLDQCRQAMLVLSAIANDSVWTVCLEYWEKWASLAGPIDPAFAKCLITIIVPRVDRIDKSMSQVLMWAFSMAPQDSLTYLTDQLTMAMKTNDWDQLAHVGWAVTNLSDVALADDSLFAQPMLQVLLNHLDQSATSTLEITVNCLEWTARILGHFPRFLEAHYQEILPVLWPVLWTALHDSNPSTKSIACDALVQLCQAGPLAMTSSLLPIAHQPFTQILKNLDSLIADWHLSKELETIYGALGYVIVALDPGKQELAMGQVMKVPMEKLQTLQSSITTGSALSIDQWVMLRTLLRLCVSLGNHSGPIFQKYFEHWIPWLIQLYPVLNQHPGCQSPQGKLCMVVKDLCCDLLVIQASQPHLTNSQLVRDFLQVIMADYHSQGFISAAPVLTMMAKLIETLKLPWVGPQNALVGMLLEPTLAAIKGNMEDLPEHRLGFFTLLHAVVRHYFNELLQWPLSEATLLVDSLLWGAKHTLLEIAQPSLEACLSLVDQAQALDDEDLAGLFHQSHYMRLLSGVLQVLTDPDCHNALSSQSRLLATLLQIIEEGQVYVPVFDPSHVPNPLMSNTDYIMAFVQSYFTQTFPFLASHQVEVMVRGMFTYSDQPDRFQEDLEDFLVDIREVEDEETGQQLHLEEQQAEQQLFLL